MGIHMNRGVDDTNDNAGELPLEKMKRYITYCRQ